MVSLCRWDNWKETNNYLMRPQSLPHDFRAQARTPQVSSLLLLVLTMSPLFRQLWLPPPFPVATEVAAALEVEAWVLVGAAATPSPPVVGTAWVQASGAPASVLAATGALGAVAPVSNLSPLRPPVGRAISTKYATLLPETSSAH